MTNRLATYEDLLTENAELKAQLGARIQALKLRPEDILVLTYKSPVRKETVQRLSTIIEDWFPDINTMVLSEDPKLNLLLSLLRKSE